MAPTDIRQVAASTATETGPVRPAKPRTAWAEGGCTHGPEVPCVACDTGRCPVCDKLAVFNRGFARWMHADGTDNAKCWRWTP